MAKQYSEITTAHQAFIEQQQIFFVGTAGQSGRVNVSPKGMDSLRVLGPQRVLWLSVTGSGNESAAHVTENGRMTVMFCSFQGAPMILRLYGEARLIYPRDVDWEALIDEFPPLQGTRQLFDLQVDLVQTSCGMAVPLYEYQGQRDTLNQWAKQKGPAGIEAYWAEKNQVSIDDMPTHIFAEEVKS